MPVSRLAIVGTGLIGASVGLAAKRAGVPEVSALGPRPAARSGGRGAGRRRRGPPNARRGARGGRAGRRRGAGRERSHEQVAATLAASPGDCTVTDVGSTKAGVCAAAPDRVRFIGGHPVCGSEARGPEHASAELFQGATWFLTPVAETDPARYRTLHGFVVVARRRSRWPSTRTRTIGCWRSRATCRTRSPTCS